MTASKKEDKEPRAPYEPPKLFDLGGGVAYAATGACRTGGSPGVTACNSGGTASGGRCRTGTAAAANCLPGTTASFSCKPGTTAFSCRAGGKP